jgi:hypothetical protein
MRAAARAKVDQYGFVQGVCGAPTFDHAGVAAEGQAFFLMMEVAASQFSAGPGFAGTMLAVQAGQGTAKAAEPAPKTGFNVLAFGAAGDGKALETDAVNKAIAAAAAAGGGTVLFPAGSYLCRSIHLASNVDLYLDQGCTVVAADPAAPGESGGYDAAEPNDWSAYQDYGHSHWHNSLFWGEGISNIAILGPGLIWGKGLSKGYGPGPVAEHAGVGNKAISLKNCHNVLLRDFAILHGGHFGILATGVDNLTIDNLRIDTNRDGMDVDCCRNVRISNCYVNSPWDDGICLKSCYGLGSAKPTEFVTITNCYVSGCFEEGTLLDGTYKRFAEGVRVPHTGRIKFGTESNGGFRNITDLQLRLRRLPGAGSGVRGWRAAGRRNHHQHLDAGYHQRAYLPAPGQPHARTGGTRPWAPQTGHHQQPGLLQFRLPARLCHQRNSGPRHRGRHDQPRAGLAPRRRHERTGGDSATRKGNRLSGTEYVRHDAVARFLCPPCHRDPVRRR